MIYPIWRLSEYHSDNLGLAFTDGGLLLGRIPLIERRDGRFVVRERSEIARLVKYSFPNGVAIDRPLPGLTIVASALNANNQAGARIAAVHLQIPNLRSSAARDAMIAEDALIKYARDGGGASDWVSDLHPRTGTPPNSGWFATTGGHREEPGQDEFSSSQSRLRIAANEDGSRRTDVTSSADDQQTLQPGNPIDEPANLTDRPDWNHFWSDTWPAIKDWLVSRYLNMTSRAVRRRASGRAGEPLRLISAFPPRLRRPLVSRLLRQRSQHGLASMLLKHPSSQMPYAAPRQRLGY